MLTFILVVVACAAERVVDSGEGDRQVYCDPAWRNGWHVGKTTAAGYGLTVALNRPQFCSMMSQ